jgi:hypothetical protein
MRSLTPGQKNRLCYMTRGKGETHDLCRHPLVKELTRGYAYFIRNLGGYEKFSKVLGGYEKFLKNLGGTKNFQKIWGGTKMFEIF